MTNQTTFWGKTRYNNNLLKHSYCHYLRKFLSRNRQEFLYWELKEGACTGTEAINECESEDQNSFDGDSTILAINTDNSDTESDVEGTNPKLLLDIDDRTLIEYKISKAGENKQETDSHTNKNTSLSVATKHHATHKETVKINWIRKVQSQVTAKMYLQIFQKQSKHYMIH